MLYRNETVRYADPQPTPSLAARRWVDAARTVFDAVVQTSGGDSIDIRAVDIARDAGAIHDLLRALDARSLAARFLGVGDASIAWLEARLHRAREHRALAAFAGTRAIALLDYVAGETLEFGLVVAGDVRRRRIATTLLATLISQTNDACGAVRLIADCDVGNVPARALLEAFDFALDERPGSETSRFVLRYGRSTEPPRARSAKRSASFVRTLPAREPCAGPIVV